MQYQEDHNNKEARNTQLWDVPMMSRKRTIRGKKGREKVGQQEVATE